MSGKLPRSAKGGAVALGGLVPVRVVSGLFSGLVPLVVAVQDVRTVDMTVRYFVGLVLLCSVFWFASEVARDPGPAG